MENEITLFRQRLLETAAWCRAHPRTPPSASVLRTGALRPALALEERAPIEVRRACIDSLCSARRELLATQRISVRAGVEEGG